MKPEEKYFVIKGIREDFQWYNREEGYWLCSKNDYGITHDYFYKDKAEAEKECEENREKYRQAIAYIKEGDEVWFIFDYHINVSKVINIECIGSEVYYRLNGCDKQFLNNNLFKSKEDLLNYLESNIQYLK